MIDVFIRTMSNQSTLRDAMHSVTEARWALENVRIITITDMGIREGRKWAESSSNSDPYIYTDDDVLIVGKDWVARAVSVLLANPEYAVASTLSLVEGENVATGTGDMYPMHAVGAPMIIRKGILADLPEMNIDQECGIIHKYILDKGFKEGLISGIRHNHMGHGFSSNPVLRWGF